MVPQKERRTSIEFLGVSEISEETKNKLNRNCPTEPPREPSGPPPLINFSEELNNRIDNLLRWHRERVEQKKTATGSPDQPLSPESPPPTSNQPDSPESPPPAHYKSEGEESSDSSYNESEAPPPMVYRRYRKRYHRLSLAAKRNNALLYHFRDPWGQNRHFIS